MARATDERVLIVERLIPDVAVAGLSGLVLSLAAG
jgi:hypothetical protein